MTRDPRHDPRPGDLLTDADWCVRVDAIRDGLVFVAVYPPTGHPSTSAVPLREWTEATKDAAVMALADDDPMQTRTVIDP
jgi:hypothetical protein